MTWIPRAKICSPQEATQHLMLHLHLANATVFFAIGTQPAWLYGRSGGRGHFGRKATNKEGCKLYHQPRSEFNAFRANAQCVTGQKDPKNILRTG